MPRQFESRRMSGAFALLFCILTLSLSAEEYRYEIDSTLLGKVGSFKVSKKIFSGRYEVKISAKTEGVAAFLTKNRKEKYVFGGYLNDGRYSADYFEIERKMKNRHEIDRYTIDYRDKKIYKIRLRYKNAKAAKKRVKSLKYFSDMDFPSFYENIIVRLCNAKNAEKIDGTYVAGAEKADGLIDARRAAKSREKEELSKLKLKSGRIVILSAPAELFGKKNRELILALDANGSVAKARFSALPIVGNIYIERIDPKRSP